MRHAWRDGSARNAPKRRLEGDGLATGNTKDFGHRGSQLVGMMMAGMRRLDAKEAREVDLTTATEAKL